ncbi:LysR substrate binding domain [Slackia heliotrinireducens]|uniref:LysR family regulator n=2 Tax=Slackia TaxID=84108 RepID=C7N7C1_SLAHD|nr:LysR family regulator [Slackia heliotrinireducens DSM 20476]VEH01514.1 LysR substrate binding domain [Slackia heliotrinireducens]
MKQVGFKVKHGGRGEDYGAALTLVESGLGFGCIPISFCRNDSRFKAIPFNDLDVHLSYRLAWARENVSAATSTFASFLENEDWPCDAVE